MSLLDPISSDPSFRWTERHARHLLNRAGFGVPVSTVIKLSKLTPEAAVAAFVDFDNMQDISDPAPELPEKIPYRKLRQMTEMMTEDERRKFRNDLRQKDRQAMTDLQGWWIGRMAKTARPLQEKVALMWHGHFATSAEKVTEPHFNLELNQIFRQQGTGNFRELVRAVGKSPAMLRYLDQQQSTKDKPNENWARELMELFTLGQGQYTERDIKEAARAFTGWSERDGEFFFNDRRHDFDLKVLFKKRAGYDGDGVIDNIVTRRECGEFICKKIWTYFAYDNPEPEVIKGLADTFYEYDTNLRPVFRKMFLSKAFYQSKAMNTQVKSPAQLVVGLMVQLDCVLSPNPPIAQLAMRAMGQSLFYPPNVKGWDGGRDWINTNTLLVRYNFSNYLVSGVIPDFANGGNGYGNIRRQLMLGNPMRSHNDMDGGDAMAGGMGGMMGGDDAGDGMMGGDKPRNAAEEIERGPIGQDAMPRDIPSKTFYQILTDNPRKNDNKKRKDNKPPSPMELAPFDAREFFAQYQGKNAEEILLNLTGYFIGFPLEEQQYAKLKNALAPGLAEGKIVPLDKVHEEDLRATIQLLLSTAEYQVC